MCTTVSNFGFTSCIKLSNKHSKGNLMDKRIENIQKHMRSHHEGEVGRGKQGALISHLNREAGSDTMRKYILFVWFRMEEGDDIQELSTKKLTQGEWQAIDQLADPFEVQGEWLTTVSFRRKVDVTKRFVVFKLP